MSDSLRPHESQHARPPCPSPTPGVQLRLTSIESVMPSSHLILCRPLLLLPPIPSSIRVFSNESTLIVIFLIVWGWFCKSFFLLLCFLTIQVSLTFVVKLIWRYWILLTFACLKLLISLSILNEMLAGYSNLGCRFSPLSTLNMPFPSGLQSFCWKISC